MPVIIKWNPADDLFVLNETFSQMLDQVSNIVQKRKTSETSSAWAAIADMYETDDAFILHIELAGIDKESLEEIFFKKTHS